MILAYVREIPSKKQVIFSHLSCPRFLRILSRYTLVVVSRQLGHAQASTTANIYAHAIASAQAKAMQTFDRFNDIVGTEKPPEEGMKKAAGN